MKTVRFFWRDNLSWFTRLLSVRNLGRMFLWCAAEWCFVQ